MFGLRSVRKIEPRDIHPGIDHPLQNLRNIGGGPQGSNNFSFSLFNHAQKNLAVKTPINNPKKHKIKLPITLRPANQYWPSLNKFQVS